MAVTSIGNLQPGNVHTDQIVTSLAMKYEYPELVGEIFAPITPVSKKSDIYPIFYGDDENIVYDDAMGPGGQLKQVDFGAHTDSYNCEGHGLENTEPWETIANADPAWMSYLELGALAGRLRHLVRLVHETKVATLFNTSGNYASGHYYSLTTDQFDDSGINGLERLETEIRVIRLLAGGSPIHMGMTGDVAIKMRNDSNFIPSLTGSLVTSWMQLQETLGLGGIHIVDAQKNTADKGQTPSRSAIWTANSIWLFVRGANGTRNTPSAAKTFQWTDPALGVAGGEGFRSGRDERYRNNWAQWVKYYDVKATGVDTAGAFQTATWLTNVYN